MCADFLINGKTRRYEDGVRTQAIGLAAWQGGMYAETPRFIAGSGNHATTIRRAADHDGFAAQGGVVALLDRGKKGIHINMDDFAHGLLLVKKLQHALCRASNTHGVRACGNGAVEENGMGGECVQQFVGAFAGIA